MSTSWSVTHDYAYHFGGAEMVTRTICHDVFDSPDLIALAGRREVLDAIAGTRATTVLPGRPPEQLARALAPVLPLLAGSRVVEGNLLASSYAFAHHIRCTGRKVVYCHSPLRQAWSGADQYRKHGPLAERLGVALTYRYLRKVDRRASRSADAYVATSRAVRNRIERFYGRSDIAVVPPPYDSSTFFLREPATDRNPDAFVWVGRIVEPYKQLGLVLDAFRQLPGCTLTVVGDGRDRCRLEAGAPANVRFVGWRSGGELAELYRTSAALIFPSEDDFGIVPVEAMACGTPVVAFGRGGAEDTVVPGESGVLFPEQETTALLTALSELRRETWKPEVISRSAAGRFGSESFVRALSHYL